MVFRREDAAQARGGAKCKKSPEGPSRIMARPAELPEAQSALSPLRIAAHGAIGGPRSKLQGSKFVHGGIVACLDNRWFLRQHVL
jgi:hypothetical protein